MGDPWAKAEGVGPRRILGRAGMVRLGCSLAAPKPWPHWTRGGG